MSILFHCENCGSAVMDDAYIHANTEDEWCEECCDKWFQEQAAYWRPLYEAEKRAGLLKSLDELEAELRDAGRGHLIGG